MTATAHYDAPVVTPPAKPTPSVAAFSVEPPPHRHHHVALWQVWGSAHLEIAGEEIRLHAGRLAWVPAGWKHTIHIDGDSAILPARFQESPTTEQITRPLVAEVHEEMKGPLLAQVQASCTIIRPPAGGENDLVTMIRQAEHRGTGVTMPLTGPARDVARHLARHPSDSSSGEDLAASVHCSVRTLQRSFLEQTGITLQAWRQQNRLETAKRMLRRGTSPGAASLHVGYISQSSFGRVFKTSVGLTPRQYAQRYSPQKRRRHRLSAVV